MTRVYKELMIPTKQQQRKMLFYWIGILLRIIILAAQTTTSSTQFLHVSDIEIFENFLNYNHLHHGLMIVNKRDSKKLNKVGTNNLMQLLSQKRIRFYNVAAGVDFQQLFHYNSPRLGVFVSNMTCALTKRKVFQAASEGNFFNFSQSWLLMMNQTNGVEITTFQNIFENYNINVDADVTLGIRSKNNTVLLYDVFKICHDCGSTLEMNYKGNWTTGTGFDLLPEFHESFVRRRRNFHGVHLKGSISLTEKPEHMNWTDYLEDANDNKHLDTMQRKTYHLLKIVPNTLNFSFDVLYAKSWGQLKNGNWTGIIAHLVSGEAEFSLCPIRYTLERVHAIHFTPTIHTEIIRFLLRHPRRNVIRNIFLEPFVEIVWWCVFALILCSIFLLRLLLQQEYRVQRLQRQNQILNQRQTIRQTKQHRHRQHQQQHHYDMTPLENRLDFSMLMILSAVLMQGPSPDAFKLISTRTLIITICIFSVMLLQFYAAFIVGSLLAEAPRTITNVHALYNSTLDIGMEDVSYMYELFINTTNQEAKDIYAHRIAKNPRGNILTMARGVERIGRGGFAFYTGVERAYRVLKYKLTELEFCDLQEIALYPPFTSSAITRLGSPYREHFTNSILHLRATGLMQYNDKMWQVKKTDCSMARSTEVEVDIEHFVPALAFLAFAMLITLFTLLLEVVINWWRQPQHHQRISEMEKKKSKNTQRMLTQNSKQNSIFPLR